jgi:hypothetical protein
MGHRPEVSHAVAPAVSGRYSTTLASPVVIPVGSEDNQGFPDFENQDSNYGLALPPIVHDHTWITA